MLLLHFDHVSLRKTGGMIFRCVPILCTTGDGSEVLSECYIWSPQGQYYQLVGICFLYISVFILLNYESLM
uniref:Uncharacterized protein n=1 Tax=Anguilla anguilla TaxID=7936 RepID=A0A0E9X6K5_ANGAN